MQTLKILIAAVWVVFWVGWLVSAGTAKRSVKGRGLMRGGGIRIRALSAICVVIILRLDHHATGSVHSPVLGAVGAVVFAAGLAVAVWARVHLGRNWGMPMTERAEPELITSGPYRLVRHPIYTGLILALVGTALATNLIGLIVFLIPAAYFYFSATVEERNLTATFPQQYPAYQQHTKKLIPFLL
jgi:protein-S-isoprenylcysteine O-methyltransferase Ste14